MKGTLGHRPLVGKQYHDGFNNPNVVGILDVTDVMFELALLGQGTYGIKGNWLSCMDQGGNLILSPCVQLDGMTFDSMGEGIGPPKGYVDDKDHEVQFKLEWYETRVRGFQE